MRQKNSYSRIIQNLEFWEPLSNGGKIRLFHHSIEKGITSFYLDHSRLKLPSSGLGNALSESGLSRDEIQLIVSTLPEGDLQQEVGRILDFFETDYLDLLIPTGESEGLLPVLDQLHYQGKIVETGTWVKKAGEESGYAGKLPVWATLSEFRPEPAALKLLAAMENPEHEISEILLLKEPLLHFEPEKISLFCDKVGLSPEEVVLTWILQHERNFHTIVRADSEVKIDSAHKALHTHLIGDDWNKLPWNL